MAARATKRQPLDLGRLGPINVAANVIRAA
jgi:hypothetical protein